MTIQMLVFDLRESDKQFLKITNYKISTLLFMTTALIRKL